MQIDFSNKISVWNEIFVHEFKRKQIDFDRAFLLRLEKKLHSKIFATNVDCVYFLLVSFVKKRLQITFSRQIIVNCPIFS